MDVTRRILEAVARADLIVCAAVRVAVVVGLSLLLILLMWRVREWAMPRAAPEVIPYDVTSEGPEGYTKEWEKWRTEE